METFWGLDLWVPDILPLQLGEGPQVGIVLEHEKRRAQCDHFVYFGTSIR